MVRAASARACAAQVARSSGVMFFGSFTAFSAASSSRSSSPRAAPGPEARVSMPSPSIRDSSHFLRSAGSDGAEQVLDPLEARHPAEALQQAAVAPDGGLVGVRRPEQQPTRALHGPQLGCHPHLLVSVPRTTISPRWIGLRLLVPARNRSRKVGSSNTSAKAAATRASSSASLITPSCSETTTPLALTSTSIPSFSPSLGAPAWSSASIRPVSACVALSSPPIIP